VASPSLREEAEFGGKGIRTLARQRASMVQQSPFNGTDSQYIPNESQAVSFLRNRFFSAVPEFFCGRAEFSFERGQTDGDWFRLGRESH